MGAIMLIEIWERLRGYDKWIQTEATIQSSDLNEMEIGKVRDYSLVGSQSVEEWNSSCVLAWTDKSGNSHEAEFDVAEDSPLFQLYDGQKVAIRYNPANPDQFYLRGVSASKVHTWFKQVGIFLINIFRYN
jgi:hypothetical protein